MFQVCSFQWKKWYKSLYVLVVPDDPQCGFMTLSEVNGHHNINIWGQYIRLNSSDGIESLSVSRFKLIICADNIYFKEVVRSIVCYRTRKKSMDHDTLRGFILLAALNSRNHGIIRSVLYDMMQPSKLEDYTDLRSLPTFDSISSLAAYIAVLFLRNDSDDALNDSDSDNPWKLWDDVDFLQPSRRYPKVYNPITNAYIGSWPYTRFNLWVYGLLRAPAVLIQSCWAKLFRTAFCNFENLPTSEPLAGALFFGASLGNDAVVKALLVAELNPNLRMNWWFGDRIYFLGKCTALHLAAYQGHVSVVRTLIEHGADIDTLDTRKQTPLEWAKQNRNEAMENKLLSREARPGLQGNPGRTPLHHAAARGQEAVVRELLRHKASIDVQDDSEQTPLLYAAKDGHNVVVQELLKHKAKTDIQDKYGKTALHHAAFWGNKAMVRELLKHKAKTDLPDRSGRTALHEAAGNGHTAVVRELLKHNAKTHIQDNCGRTALDLAEETGRTFKDTVPLNGTTELLRAHGAVSALGTAEPNQIKHLWPSIFPQFGEFHQAPATTSPPSPPIHSYAVDQAAEADKAINQATTNPTTHPLETPQPEPAATTTKHQNPTTRPAQPSTPAPGPPTE